MIQCLYSYAKTLCLSTKSAIVSHAWSRCRSSRHRIGALDCVGGEKFHPFDRKISNYPRYPMYNISNLSSVERKIRSSFSHQSSKLGSRQEDRRFPQSNQMDVMNIGSNNNNGGSGGSGGSDALGTVLIMHVNDPEQIHHPTLHTAKQYNKSPPTNNNQ